MATKQTDKTPDLEKEIEKSAKLFDVAKPGESAPSATSRPIILGHAKTITTDPMVREESATDEKKEEAVPVRQNSQPKVIAPLSATEELKKAPEDNQVEEAAQPEAEKPVEEEPKVEPETPSAHGSDEAAVVDAIAQEADGKRQSQKEAEALAVKAEEVKKSIESKEFFVPIGQESRRRSYRLVIVGLILLIAIIIAGFNLALDADLLDIGVEPLTNLL